MSFERFTRPVIEFLRSLGLDAAFSGRNDIQVSGYKISGNAQTRCGDRFMHHGTLLFGANMTDLSRALTVHPLKIQGKSIRSVRARVANISEFLAEPMEVTAFMDKLLAFVEAQYPDGEAYAFTEADRAAIARLCEEKYAQWSWNFGENPAYSFQKTAKFDGGLIEVRMDIEGERIARIRIAGDFSGLRRCPSWRPRSPACGMSRSRSARRSQAWTWPRTWAGLPPNSYCRRCFRPGAGLCFKRQGLHRNPARRAGGGNWDECARGAGVFIQIKINGSGEDSNVCTRSGLTMTNT